MPGWQGAPPGAAGAGARRRAPAGTGAAAWHGMERPRIRGSRPPAHGLRPWRQRPYNEAVHPIPATFPSPPAWQPGPFRIQHRDRAMYAVIETGGKQYRVSEGEVVRVERLGEDVGSEVSLDAVHLLSDGDTIHVGTPSVDGARVEATVVDNGKGRKVIAFKKKRRKGYRRKIGHRQHYTALRIDRIVGP